MQVLDTARVAQLETNLDDISGLSQATPPRGADSDFRDLLLCVRIWAFAHHSGVLRAFVCDNFFSPLTYTHAHLPTRTHTHMMARTHADAHQHVPAHTPNTH